MDYDFEEQLPSEPEITFREERAHENAWPMLEQVAGYFVKLYQDNLIRAGDDGSLLVDAGEGRYWQLRLSESDRTNSTIQKAIDDGPKPDGSVEEETEKPRRDDAKLIDSTGFRLEVRALKSETANRKIPDFVFEIKKVFGEADKKLELQRAEVNEDQGVVGRRTWNADKEGHLSHKGTDLLRLDYRGRDRLADRLKEVSRFNTDGAFTGVDIRRVLGLADIENASDYLIAGSYLGLLAVFAPRHLVKIILDDQPPYLEHGERLEQHNRQTERQRLRDSLALLQIEINGYLVDNPDVTLGVRITVPGESVRGVSVNENKVYFPASIQKVWVAMLALKLSEEGVIDRTTDIGGGFTLESAIEDMIIISGNNSLIQIAQAITSLPELGLDMSEPFQLRMNDLIKKYLSVDNTSYWGDDRTGGYAATTASDVHRIMTDLYHANFVSYENSQYLIELMKSTAQVFRWNIPYAIEFVSARNGNGRVEVAHKVGWGLPERGKSPTMHENHDVAILHCDGGHDLIVTVLGYGERDKVAEVIRWIAGGALMAVNPERENPPQFLPLLSESRNIVAE